MQKKYQPDLQFNHHKQQQQRTTAAAPTVRARAGDKSHSRVPLYEAVRALAAVAGGAAQPVVAGLARRAVVVPDALGRHGRLHRLAAEVVDGHPADAAGAHHRAEGDGVADGAGGGGVARAKLVAGVKALGPKEQKK